VTKRNQYWAILLSLSFVYCEKKQDSAPSVNVFVAGYEFQPTPPIHYIVKYWKNDKPVVLSSTGYLANSIAVSGNDVYVAGLGFGITYPIAKYWKNGSSVNLTNGSKNANVTAIVVSNGDVYVSGSETNDTNDTAFAKYWKNGIPIDLHDNGSASANSIAVIGNDVYVAGDTRIGNRHYARLWKNGALVNLKMDSSKSYYGIGIFINGPDVYVAGFEQIASGFRTAMYWKNGEPVILGDGIKESHCRSIFVTGTNVYVAGSENPNGGTITGIAKYWKNGVGIDLTDKQGSSAKSISVWENEVYIAGEVFNGTSTVATYWKNGVPVYLSDPSNDGFAYSIFLSRP
jgi:hypothetical protein